MMNNELRPYMLTPIKEIHWIDSIPAHWDVQRGKAVYKKLNRPTREADDVVTCFRDGIVTLRKNRRTTGFTESLKEIGYQGIRKGDLVIHVMDAFAGAVGVSDSDGKGTPVYSVCESKADLNNYYYAYVIREMAKTGFIQSLYRGIRERSSDFRFEVFANQYLPIPPRTEQDRIVKYLDYQLAKINKFIHVKKKLIAVLKEQKQAIINEAVTKGLDPHVKMKPSGIEWLGDVPEHWEIKRIKGIAKILRGKFNHRPRNDQSLYNGEYPFIQTGDVARAGKYLTEYKQTLNEKGYSVSKQFPENTLTMAIAANIGDVAILTFSACFPDSVIGFVPIKEVNLEFMYYALFAMKSEFMKEAPVNTQGNLNVERVGNMKLVIPEYEEQISIAKYLVKKTNIIDKNIALISKEIHLINEYKNSLISAAVTGRVDVRNIVIDELEEEITEYIEIDEDSIDEETPVKEEGDE